MKTVLYRVREKDINGLIHATESKRDPMSFPDPELQMLAAALNQGGYIAHMTTLKDGDLLIAVQYDKTGKG